MNITIKQPQHIGQFESLSFTEVLPEPDELTNPLSDFWSKGLRHLPPQLKEAAYLRLYKPEASLTEIGESLTPPVGKAAISKRFAKLRALAENAGGNDPH